MMRIVNIRTQLLQCDTTNFSVYGDYKHIDGSSAIEITYGHANEGKDDLQRFGLGIITNQYGIPLFAKTYSGNALDKDTIIEAMKKLQENITFPDDVYYIADSALYSDNNIKSMRKDMEWITRVPSTLNFSKDLLISDLEFKPGNIVHYVINTEAVRNEEVMLNEKEHQGRFVIASNDLNLDAEKMLDYYKNQSKVEKGFRFIKDKSFRVSEVYLKKPQRIEALSMVMVLTLMVYSVAE